MQFEEILSRDAAVRELTKLCSALLRCPNDMRFSTKVDVLAVDPRSSTLNDYIRQEFELDREKPPSTPNQAQPMSMPMAAQVGGQSVQAIPIVSEPVEGN